MLRTNKHFKKEVKESLYSTKHKDEKLSKSATIVILTAWMSMLARNHREEEFKPRRFCLDNHGNRTRIFFKFFQQHNGTFICMWRKINSNGKISRWNYENLRDANKLTIAFINAGYKLRRGSGCGGSKTVPRGETALQRRNYVVRKQRKKQYMIWHDLDMIISSDEEEEDIDKESSDDYSLSDSDSDDNPLLSPTLRP